jgi:hypothetical protein
MEALQFWLEFGGQMGANEMMKILASNNNHRNWKEKFATYKARKVLNEATLLVRF